jgi:hypothetical protein
LESSIGAIDAVEQLFERRGTEVGSSISTELAFRRELWGRITFA